MIHKAYSMIELSIALFIMAILLGIGFRLSASVLRQNNLTSELVEIKASIQKARGIAIASSVPVQFTFRNNRIYALSDFDRDGSFGNRDDELVIGEAIGTPVEIDYAGVTQTAAGATGVPALDHPSGLANNIADFANGSFIVSPTGQIRNSLGSPVQGAYFLISDDNFAGAVYVSPLGDMKTAIKEDTGGWTWTD